MIRPYKKTAQFVQAVLIERYYEKNCFIGLKPYLNPSALSGRKFFVLTCHFPL
jgi:hypothetical protein